MKMKSIFKTLISAMSITAFADSAVTVVTSEGAAQNGEMFNVAGQRVNGSAKGLVIKNGKKFIVK